MPAQPLSPIEPGASAAVRWVDDRFYFVRFLQALPGRSRIQFADGGIETVPPASLIPVPDRPVFRVGEEVMAVWKTDRMFAGTVQAITPQGYTVAWHDGDAPLVVPLGKLTFLAWANAAVAPPEEAATGGGGAGWQDVTAAVLGPPAGVAPGAKPPPLPPPLPGRGTPAGPTPSTLTVFIPGTIMPVDRGTRFVEPLQEALRRRNLGDILDEGTELATVAGRPLVRGCWIQITVGDVAGALPILRGALKAAGAPPETTITQHDPRRVVHALGG